MKMIDKFITKDISKRVYPTNLPLIGLTGGISSGKSSVGELLTQRGLAYISADKLIKKIYKKKEIISLVQKLVPSSVTKGTIDFVTLREHFFNRPDVKSQLESSLYTHLPSQFGMAVSNFPNANFIIYDTPLLFENKMQDKFDLTVCVYCSPKNQLIRLLKRDQISEPLAQKIIASQLDIDQKRKLADFVIDNNSEREQLARQVTSFLKEITLSDF